MVDTIHGNVLFLDPNSPLMAEGVNLPEASPPTYNLLDDDAQQCRVISESEFHPSYVDNNIQTAHFEGSGWLTKTTDEYYVTLTYGTGAQMMMLIGAPEYNAGPRVKQYLKRNGIIYPIDESGNIRLDATNTPNLVALRQWYAEEGRIVSEQNVAMAELVYILGGAVANLAHAGYQESGSKAEETIRILDAEEAARKAFKDAHDQP